MKKWQIKNKLKTKELTTSDIINVLLVNRGFNTKEQKNSFLKVQHPANFLVKDIGVFKSSLISVLFRIQKAIKNRESVVVHADYDADGITAGAIIWETLYALGARVMPYIPHREEEGRGLSKKNIDIIEKLYDSSLIITVDHGISEWREVEYAKSLGIDIIITDHHAKPKKLPKTLTIHTDKLSGSGIAYFLAVNIFKKSVQPHRLNDNELLALAAIGTVADLVTLVGPNRSIVKYGLDALRKTERIGLLALIEDSGIRKEDIDTYSVSHILAPRINAMGRLEHAMDALRLLCTKKGEKAQILARRLNLTNKRRQDLTDEAVMHAFGRVEKDEKGQPVKKILFISHSSYNQGIVGLVAGKLMEEYYRPAVVVSLGKDISKASARSIKGFDIISAIRQFESLLVNVGGHPLAAGFTVETKNLQEFQKKLEEYTEKTLVDTALTKALAVDLEIPLINVNIELWKSIRTFEPFGLGNPIPVFATTGVKILDAYRVGKDKSHLKLKLCGTGSLQHKVYDAIAFGMGNLFELLSPEKAVDIAYSIDLNEWNGRKDLQLKINDIRIG